MPESWTRVEIDTVIGDYFAMLAQELRGEEHGGRERLGALAERLDCRSEETIELRCRNISAVLLDLGYPYVECYGPAPNYRQPLADAVGARLAADLELERLVARTVAAPADPPPVEDVLSRLTPRPGCAEGDAPPPARREAAVPPVRNAVNYLELETRNTSLSLMGEVFALAYEKARLEEAGCGRLARLVEHVSVTQGDGLGYDILSLEPDGSERFIEVKTTRFGGETPFFVSATELGVSQAKRLAYHTYRVYTYGSNLRLFVLHGDLMSACRMTPVRFAARVR